MKVAVNTEYESAGTKVCVDDLIPKLEKVGHTVSRNDWEHYERYDLILFMSPDSEVRTAKGKNPEALVGIMDPKFAGTNRTAEAEAADFLAVSSIEQRDRALKYNPNVFIYYMFPEVEKREKRHEQHTPLVIGYHGNVFHLEEMKEVSRALDALSAKYDIEFRPMYNIKEAGVWEKNRPTRCLVKDIQWSEQNYYDELALCDIGIVPASKPVNPVLQNIATLSYQKIRSFLFEPYEQDYLLRFKYSTNPGRIYVFSRLGIPVVADFVPSSCQIIQDSVSGYLVQSMEGWKFALEMLIRDETKRSQMSANLRTSIDNTISPQHNFDAFIRFLYLLK